MKLREFGKGGPEITEIGLGTWQLGHKWGEPFNHDEAMRILQTAYDAGITFIDTADCYNGSQSEQAIGEFLQSHPGAFFVSTKCGRHPRALTYEEYTPDRIREFTEASLKRLGVEQLDNLLLHTPPSSVFAKDEIFAELDRLKKAGKIARYGVAIEKISEGMKALDYDISSMEVIFNMFRFKPLDELFPATTERGIAIIARVPLASGLLTGRMKKDTTFSEKDHRTFNRHGESFDKGETFSGVDYETGVEAADALKELFGVQDLVPYALKWILMHDAVSVVVPGARNPEQVLSNLRPEALPDLTPEQMAGVKDIYDRYLRADIHPQW